MRTGYGCVAIILLPTTIFVAVLVINEWKSRNTTQADGGKGPQVQQGVEALPVIPPDPFTSNAVVYSSWPLGNVLGDNRTVIPCSKNYDDAHALMLRESDTKYQIAASAGKRLLQQDYTPESEIKQQFVDYILDKQKQQQLLFLPLLVKLQIIQRQYEGDVSHASIYQCRVLQPGSEGMTLYIQSNFITERSPEQRE